MKNSKIASNPIVKFAKGNAGILIAFAALFVFLSIFSDAFLSSGNMLSVLRQICVNALLALGMTLVLIVSGIDLSVGSVVGLVGVIVVLMVNAGIPWYIAIISGLVLGALIGLINGSIVALIGMPPFIVTLAMMGLLRGVAYTLTNGRSIPCEDDFFNSIGNGRWIGIPIPVFVVAIVAVIIAIILYSMRFGRRMYAIGGNENAARFSGIKVKSVVIRVYIISAVLAALAGIILASRMYSGQPSAGQSYESDAIAAAVLGGTSFTGGIGTVGGTIIGALFIGFLTNGLNLLHISSYVQMIIKGVVIILAVTIDVLRRRKL